MQKVAWNMKKNTVFTVFFQYNRSDPVNQPAGLQRPLLSTERSPSGKSSEIVTKR